MYIYYLQIVHLKRLPYDQLIKEKLIEHIRKMKYFLYNCLQFNICYKNLFCIDLIYTYKKALIYTGYGNVYKVACTTLKNVI